MKRIYVKNNYIIIEWTGSMPLMRPQKDISFRRTNVNPNQYQIADRSNPVPGDIQNVMWIDFVKEDGTPFANQAEFNEWITANTGNFKKGSDNGEFEPSEYDLADFNNISSDPYLKQSQKPNDGEKGEKGDKGDRGEQGLSGPQGIQGIQGEKGNDGSIGPRGLKGEDGVQGPQGPIGLTGDKGDQGIQGLKGDTGAQGPKGDKGDAGSQGSQGVSGVNSFSLPTLRSGINKATAYQATVATKPSIITITLSSTSSFSLSGNVSNQSNIIIGSTNAVATGTGQIMAKYANVLGGGLVVGVSVTNTNTQTYTINLPTGYFFAILNANSTTGVTIDSVYDQSVG